MGIKGESRETVSRWCRRGRSDDGLATTETVILTVFLVAIAIAGGALIAQAMQSNAANINQTYTTPTTAN